MVHTPSCVCRSKTSLRALKRSFSMVRRWVISSSTRLLACNNRNYS